MGGYWIWQVRSKEEAVQWASRCPACDGDTLELRQIFDMADFGELSPEIVASAEVVREGISKQ